MTSNPKLGATRFLVERFLRPYWKSVVGLSLVNALVGFLISLRPLVIAPALDGFVGTKAEPAQRLSEVTLNNLGATLTSTLGLNDSGIMVIGGVVAALYVAITVVIAGLSFGAFYGIQRTRSALLRDMMVALHRHLLTLPLAYFHRRRAGDLVSRVSNDVTVTSNYLDTAARAIIQAAASIAVSVYILFRTDALFTLAVIVLGSVHMVITRMLSARVRKGAKGVADKRGVLSTALFESFSLIRLTKSFAAEPHDAGRVKDAADTMRKFDLQFRMARYAEQPLRLVTDAALIGLILLLAFYAVTQGRLSVQAAVMFFYLAQQMISPISDLSKQLLGVQQMLGSAAHVIEIFDTHSSLADGSREAWDFRNEIVLKDVEFAYEPGHPVVKGANLAIGRGEMVALVGPSGSGKSTLTDLVLRLYDVDRGMITYDGCDIREFRQGSYREKFGVVAQECLLFNATLRENIVYHRAEDDERLRHAIWAANAAEFIERLPDRLDTIVGDRGVRLSGGQRQRIAIARAIYGRPSVLVLDEATSALDTESERAVQEAINRVIEEMTAVVIAHRLSTITHADKIVVLDNGEIEAVGPHATLLKTSDIYRRLYRAQFGYAQDRVGEVAG